LKISFESARHYEGPAARPRDPLARGLRGRDLQGREVLPHVRRWASGGGPEVRQERRAPLALGAATSSWARMVTRSPRCATQGSGSRRALAA